MSSIKRHIAKTISYRLLSTSVGLILILFLFGSIEIGLGFTFMEIIFKPFLYFIHERLWFKWIKYGLKKS